MGDKNKCILITLFSIPATLYNNLWANFTEYFICSLGMYRVYYKSSQWICVFCLKNIFRIITLVWVLTFFFVRCAQSLIAPAFIDYASQPLFFIFKFIIFIASSFLITQITIACTTFKVIALFLLSFSFFKGLCIDSLF